MRGEAGDDRKVMSSCNVSGMWCCAGCASVHSERGHDQADGAMAESSIRIPGQGYDDGQSGNGVVTIPESFSGPPFLSTNRNQMNGRKPSKARGKLDRSPNMSMIVANPGRRVMQWTRQQG